MTGSNEIKRIRGLDTCDGLDTAFASNGTPLLTATANRFVISGNGPRDTFIGTTHFSGITFPDPKPDDANACINVWMREMVRLFITQKLTDSLDLPQPVIGLVADYAIQRAKVPILCP